MIIKGLQLEQQLPIIYQSLQLEQQLPPGVTSSISLIIKIISITSSCSC